MKTSQSPVIVILGPTATGKSDLAVELARTWNGEVISADSRQVYKGLDIGTGKITRKEMRGIPHYLLDVWSPKKIVSVAEWRDKAEQALADITARGKVPIICGGTGFYIRALVDNLLLPEVGPNPQLRAKLTKKTPAQLFALLQKRDPERAKTIDRHNPARLIRALEIAEALGRSPSQDSVWKASKDPKRPYRFLLIGLTLPHEKLAEKIKTRLETRLKKGMLAEARNLHAADLSWKRMRTLGLEYRWMANFLQHKITKTEFIDGLCRDIVHYAKRQMTWFRPDKRIEWYMPGKTTALKKTVRTFLTSKE